MSALDPITFPLEGSRLIEASAGTGKTFTISLLYLRLVLGHRSPEWRNARPLTPPEILVSTFTEAAVAELRDRIRARLQQAAWLFTGSLTLEDVDPPLRALYADFEADERRKGAFLLQRAAEWMDEAAIFTIHGFCQRMLREHAFHSRALFEQELKTDLKPVIATAIRDYWRQHGYALGQVGKAPETPDTASVGSHLAADLFARLIDEPEALREKIKFLIARDGSPLAVGSEELYRAEDLPSPAELLQPLTDTQQLAIEAEADARSTWQAHRDEIHQIWRDMQAGLNQKSHPQAKTDEAFVTWLNTVDAWAAGSTDLERKDLERLVEPTLKKGHEAQAFPAIGPLRSWLEAIRALDTSLADIQPRLQAHAVLWIREHVANLLHQQRAMGFEDMLIQMRRAVDRAENPAAPAMIEAIRKQYPVALIDEFQDTDPLQYGIFSAIYPLDKPEPEHDSTDTAIVLIGDPKQAIYSFRGADIHSYLTARRATEGRHATLPRNFRSTKPMVAAVNHLFVLSDQQPGGAFRFPLDDGAHNPVPFQPVEAQGRDQRLIDRRDESREVPALTAWTAPTDEVWNAGIFSEAMAVRSAGEIAALLNAGQRGKYGFVADIDADELVPVQPRDIAVLVRSAAQGQLMRQALSAYGVPAVFLSEKTSVFQSAEAADMRIWLEALAEPNRSDRIRLALATGSVALPLDELETLLRDETAFDDLCNAFHAWHRIWSAQGILAALMQLMHHLDIPARLLAPEVRERQRGERRLTNLLHLAEWLQGVDHEVDGEAALIQRLHLAMTEGADQQEIRLEQDNEMVRIVTIHSAKGLQYPIVFLPFAAQIGTDNSSAASNSKKETAAKPTRRHRHGQNVWDMRPDQHAADRAERESISEEIRLLYVALTRAEYACFLGAGPVAIGGKTVNPGKTAFGQFLGFAPGETCDAARFLSFLAPWSEHDAISVVPVPEPLDPHEHRYHPPSAPELHPPRSPRFGAFEPWQISSFSAIKAAGESHHVVPQPWAEDVREELRHELDRSEAEIEAPQAEASRKGLAEPAGQMDLLAPLAHQALHTLPRGAHIGTLLHDLLEACAERGFMQMAERQALQALIDESRHPGWGSLPDDGRAVVSDLIHDLLNVRWPLPDCRQPLCLGDLNRYQAEMEFWLASHRAPAAEIDRLILQHVAPDQARPPLSSQHINGMLKGFIDLTFLHEGRYFILDWKSNWLGPDDQAYGAEQLTRAMLDSRYDLQYVLYLVALHRHLHDRLPDYDYDRHIGGALYVFLRGIHAPSNDGHPGVYVDRPPKTLIEQIDALFAGSGTHAATGHPASEASA